MKRDWLKQQIADDLREEMKLCPDYDNGEAHDEWYSEVRLQMLPVEDMPGMYYWHLHYGDPCYDRDHTGYWGATELNCESSDFLAIAEDLIDQCEEHAAQCDITFTFEE